MDLLSSKCTWEWTAEHWKCFVILHSALCETPVLKLPDFGKPFVLEPDASDLAVKAVFLQEYDDGFHPIEYFSKKYLPAERNYVPHNKELLVIFKACMNGDVILTAIRLPYIPIINHWYILRYNYI